MSEAATPPPVPPPLPRAQRPSDGVFYLPIKKKWLITILGALLSGTGGAMWKSIEAKDTAAESAVSSGKVDDNLAGSYKALLKDKEERDRRDLARDEAIAACSTTVNDVIVRFGLLERVVVQESSTRSVEAYRRRKKPALSPVVPVALTPTPALPSTPDAAAAKAKADAEAAAAKPAPPP